MAARLTRLERTLGGTRPAPLAIARAEWARRNDGIARPILTAPDGNAKLAKSGAAGLRPAWGLCLAPAKSAGIPGVDTCARRTITCTRCCLITAGRNVFAPANLARARRTRFLEEEPAMAKAVILAELDRASRRDPIAFRPNVLSDIREEWAFPELLDLADDRGITLYGYTKWSPADRMADAVDLTYSVSERWTDRDILEVTAAGHRVALVGGPAWVARIGSTWHGRPVIDGDATDARWLDPAGGVVVLRPKGAARSLVPSANGFVRA